MIHEPGPDHPIITRLWEYQIVDFHYHCDRNDSDKSYIDIVLEKGATVRRLRFRAPRDLRIEEGFPSTRGMEILDVRHRQWEGVGVYVGNYESAPGPPTFWASTVEDLDKE